MAAQAVEKTQSLNFASRASFNYELTARSGDKVIAPQSANAQNVLEGYESSAPQSFVVSNAQNDAIKAMGLANINLRTNRALNAYNMFVRTNK